MNGCLRLPTSLADAQTIIVACTGPDWQPRFLLGLETVLFVAVVACLAFLAWRHV